MKTGVITRGVRVDTKAVYNGCLIGYGVPGPSRQEKGHHPGGEDPVRGRDMEMTKEGRHLRALSLERSFAG